MCSKKKDVMTNTSEKMNRQLVTLRQLAPCYHRSARVPDQTKYRALQASKCVQALEPRTNMAGRGTWHGFDRLSWSLPQDIPQSIAPRETR